MRLYEGDENEIPSNSLLGKNLIIETTKHIETIRINLEKCQLSVQKNGIFIGFEVLNMDEIELNVLMGQCLSRRIDNIDTMKKEASAWQSHRNNKMATINWQFTNNQARIKLKRLYPTIVY